MIWLSLITTTVGVLVFAHEHRKFKQAKQKKELIIFTVILSIGVVLNVVHFAWPEIPTPLDGVIVVLHPIVKVIFQLLS